MFDARYHGSEIAALAWYRSYLVVYMGIVMKKKLSRVICVIMVPSLF